MFRWLRILGRNALSASHDFDVESSLEDSRIRHFRRFRFGQARSPTMNSSGVILVLSNFLKIRKLEN